METRASTLLKKLKTFESNEGGVVFAPDPDMDGMLMSYGNVCGDLSIDFYILDGTGEGETGPEVFALLDDSFTEDLSTSKHPVIVKLRSLGFKDNVQLKDSDGNYPSMSKPYTLKDPKAIAADFTKLTAGCMAKVNEEKVNTQVKLYVSLGKNLAGDNETLPKTIELGKFTFKFRSAGTGGIIFGTDYVDSKMAKANFKGIPWSYVSRKSYRVISKSIVDANDNVIESSLIGF